MARLRELAKTAHGNADATFEIKDLRGSAQVFAF